MEVIGFLIVGIIGIFLRVKVFQKGSNKEFFVVIVLSFALVIFLNFLFHRG